MRKYVRCDFTAIFYENENLACCNQILLQISGFDRIDNSDNIDNYCNYDDSADKSDDSDHSDDSGDSGDSDITLMTDN